MEGARKETGGKVSGTEDRMQDKEGTGWCTLVASHCYCHCAGECLHDPQSHDETESRFCTHAALQQQHTLFHFAHLSIGLHMTLETRDHTCFQGSDSLSYHPPSPLVPFLWHQPDPTASLGPSHHILHPPIGIRQPGSQPAPQPAS